MSPGTAPDPQSEHNALAERLADRASVPQFVWAFGLSCLAFVSGGVATKLFRDSLRTPKLAYLLASLGLGCTLWALARLVRGLRLHSAEVADYQRLLTLRRQLRLDQPQLPGLPSPQEAP